MMETRIPAVAGSFYPGSAQDLEELIGGYLGNADPEPSKNLKGLIVPHAGYIYSGPVAAYGYKLLEKEKPDKLIALGPSHYAMFPGMAESGAEIWQTPLGDVETFSIGLEQNAAAHRPEHSIEVQVPFLQKVLGKFSFDPILTGEISPQEAAGVLEKRDEFLLISSDLSHYMPYGQAVEKDRNTISLIEKNDVSAFMTKGDACGNSGIAIAMELAKRKGWSFRLLNYANSGDTSGPKSNVVGYAAIAIEG
jgi:AmmeMemoRadiSam system protein B